MGGRMAPETQQKYCLLQEQPGIPKHPFEVVRDHAWACSLLIQRPVFVVVRDHALEHFRLLDRLVFEVVHALASILSVR